MCQNDMSVQARKTYNQCVINQIDTEGHRTDSTCPACHQVAVRHDFEAYHTGSVNQHYTLDCCHCGHHHCDQDDGCCSICDGNELEGYEEASKLDLVLEYLLDDIQSRGFCDGYSWSFLKFYAHQNPKLVRCYVTYFLHDTAECKAITSVSLLIKYLQRQLTTTRFIARLDQRVDAAKNETLTTF